MNWNAKLLLKINSLSGRSVFWDMFARAGAEWVILAMVVWFVTALYIMLAPDYRAFGFGIMIMGALWAGGFLLDNIIGMIVRQPRPHLKYPELRLLVIPLSVWKSFPSDHAFSAFFLFFLALVFGLPTAWALLPLALWVAWGRMYVGVHYPFDIIGGASVAGLFAIIGFYLLNVVGLVL